MTRHTHPLLVLLALATGGFAIGTTEFATMSLLPFIQSDMAISPIARELAEHMNATVGFDTVQGEGSTFWIKLPCTPAPAQA